MSNDYDFTPLFQPFTDAINEASESIRLAAQCKMRRFYVVYQQEPSNVRASGIVFEDGIVVVRWQSDTAIYANVEALLEILQQRQGSKLLIKYIDAEQKP